MRKIKLLLAASTALVTMAFAVSSASAYDINVSPAGGISASSGSLTFSDSDELFNIICPVTLSGRVDTGPISEMPGNQFGEINSATIGTCNGGRMVALVNSLTPWPLTLNTVLGTLPNAATGLLFTVVGAKYELTASIIGIPIRCLYEGNAGALFGVTGTNPYTSDASIDVLPIDIPFRSGSGFCPSRRQLRGSFNFSPQQTITVT